MRVSIACWSPVLARSMRSRDDSAATTSPNLKKAHIIAQGCAKPGGAAFGMMRPSDRGHSQEEEDYMSIPRASWSRAPITLAALILAVAGVAAKGNISGPYN